MKRIFAFITAIALIIGMIPVTYASEKNANCEYLFNLSSHNHTDSGETDIRNGEFRLDNMSDESLSAPWGFINCSNVHSAIANETSFEWLINDDIADSVVAFEVFVENSGNYNPKLCGITSQNGFAAKVFLIKKPQNAAEWFDSSNMDFYENVKKV